MAISAAVSSPPLAATLSSRILAERRPKVTDISLLSESLCRAPYQAALTQSVRRVKASRFSAEACPSSRFFVTRSRCQGTSPAISSLPSSNLATVAFPLHGPTLRGASPCERAPLPSEPSDSPLSSAATSATVMGAIVISPSFTPLPSLAGGVLIGLAASLYLFLLGRIMGVSGIVNGASNPTPIIGHKLVLLAATPFMMRDRCVTFMAKQP